MIYIFSNRCLAEKNATWNMDLPFKALQASKAKKKKKSKKNVATKNNYIKGHTKTKDISKRKNKHEIVSTKTKQEKLPSTADATVKKTFMIWRGGIPGYWGLNITSAAGRQRKVF